MLSKEVCGRCCVKRGDALLFFFEKEWGRNSVFCPMVFHGMGGHIRIDGDAPAECLYKLEHIVSEKEIDYGKGA